MGGEDAMQNFSPVENATIGVAAGTIEVTILQPMSVTVILYHDLAIYSSTIL